MGNMHSLDETMTLIGAINGMSKLDKIFEQMPKKMELLNMAMLFLQYDAGMKMYEEMMNDVEEARKLIDTINEQHKKICDFDTENLGKILGISDIDLFKRSLTVQFASKTDKAVTDWGEALDFAKKALDKIKSIRDKAGV